MEVPDTSGGIEVTERKDQGAAGARNAVKSAASEELETQTGPTLRELIAVQESEIARALPLAMDAARYVRIVQTELRKNPKLMQCSPQSFLGAVLTAAQLGLEFGPLGQAFLVPYGREIQLQIGFKGYLNLINRNGSVQSVSARAVHAKDVFDYSFGLDETLVHRPATGERGPIVAFYCIVRSVNGGRNVAVMTREEVEAHRDRYATRGGHVNKVWADNFEEMGMKTVFLKAAKWMAVSTELQMAQNVDDHVVRRMTVDEEVTPLEPEDDEIVDAELIDQRDTAYDRGE